MKYLNHKFYDVPNDRPLFNDDICLYCNKFCAKLFENISYEDTQKIDKELKSNNYKSNKVLETQFEWLKNNTKCITEEEYIIKKLLE